MAEKVDGDSREKLEADMREYFSHWIGGTSRTQAAIIGWLDRQAAITRAEVFADGEYDCMTCDAKRELQAKLDAYDETHMLLPVDADGVPIHVGDTLECHANGYDGKFEVFAVGPSVVIGNHDIEFVTRHPTDWFHVARYCHHVKTRTLEAVLREFAQGIDGQNADFAELAVGEYAAKIRELLGVDE